MFQILSLNRIQYDRRIKATAQLVLYVAGGQIALKVRCIHFNKSMQLQIY